MKHPFLSWVVRVWALLTLLAMSQCSHHAPLSTVTSVDLPRFMGLWYVIGYTPIVVDKDAYNAVEHYYLRDDGRILTTYQFRKGGFDGPIKTHTPKGRVHNHESNAEWRMQFLWPFQAEYLIHYLSESYETTVIAHPNRKYAWIMHRTPDLDNDRYEELLTLLEEAGFDRSGILKVEHDWSGEQARLARFNEVGKAAPLGK
jgi:apolipoprotein D and lipocalin family protein